MFLYTQKFGTVKLNNREKGPSLAQELLLVLSPESQDRELSFFNCQV